MGFPKLAFLHRRTNKKKSDFNSYSNIITTQANINTYEKQKEREEVTLWNRVRMSQI